MSTPKRKKTGKPLVSKSYGTTIFIGRRVSLEAMLSMKNLYKTGEWSAHSHSQECGVKDVQKGFFITEVKDRVVVEKKFQQKGKHRGY